MQDDRLKLTVFFSQMPGALGTWNFVQGQKGRKFIFGEIWLPSQNARTRVRLLYLQTQMNKLTYRSSATLLSAGQT